MRRGGVSVGRGPARSLILREGFGFVMRPKEVVGFLTAFGSFAFAFCAMVLEGG